jgi:hypothetical protein
MPKITPRASITAKGVESALARAAAGHDGEIKDGACVGLALRMRAGRVSWTIRWLFGDRYRRWTIGDHETLPDEARRRAWHVKSCCRQGINPTTQVVAWTTGMPIYKQDELREKRGPKSIGWDSARTLFLDHIFRTRRPATYDDYRGILQNLPEFARFDGRSVAQITEFDVAGVYADVAKRSEAHAEHAQRVLCSMWTFLAAAENRQTTGVVPGCIAHVRAPERTRREIGDPDAPAEADAAPPDRLQIGRYMAIARLGVFGERMSAALLLLAGTAQRRRPIAGANTADFKSFGDEWLWMMPPYFRKTARKKRSRGRHLVPLIGFAAQAADRLDKLAGEQPWLLPVARARRVGQQPKLPHVNPRAVSDAIESMPGVEFSSHGLRAALATYGPEDLGWLAADAKLILDHLEGFDAADVTAQHYNTHPELMKKRSMMSAWVSWLEAQEAKAVAADPTLLDREAIAEQVYRIRYGEDAWKRAIERKRQPWRRIAKNEFKEAAE